MNARGIIQAIELRVSGTRYSSWTIGITADPPARRHDHSSRKNTEAWTQWQADNEDTARYVEGYFIDKGMDGGTGGGHETDPPTIVYIF